MDPAGFEPATSRLRVEVTDVFATDRELKKQSVPGNRREERPQDLQPAVPLGSGLRPRPASAPYLPDLPIRTAIGVEEVSLLFATGNIAVREQTRAAFEGSNLTPFGATRSIRTLRH